MLKDLILRSRTYRRFYQNEAVSVKTLCELIDLSRLSRSPMNRQALKFIIENRPKQNAEIFNFLGWAGALPDWPGPEEGERPSAYIIILGDNGIKPEVPNAYHDVSYGIAAQSIMLGATEKGLGGCMIAAVDKKGLTGYLKLDDRYQILLVLAIGKPKEKVILTEMPENNSYHYRRDENAVHYVPKRKLSDIIITKPT